MPDRVTIAETQLQPLKGTFPDVPTYPHVDTAMLYEGDVDTAFHIILPIAEIGRISDNGLEYDEELVSTIAEQMSGGAGGIRGHIPDDELGTAYPVDDVHWIGHLMQGKTLWAKGYIPPGKTRDDIRMKKARGGNVATSIFGDAIKELSAASAGIVAESSRARGKNTWKARQFVLEQIDLAPTKRAALKNKHGFVITREMEGEEMPDLDKIISAADVPQPIREQIIRESDLAAKAGRVAEMETEVANLNTQVAELVTYKQIVMEIRTTLGKDTDTAAAVAEQHRVGAALAEMLGVDYSNITITVSEMYETVKELKRKAFDGAVDTQIAELTKWNPTTDDGKKKVAQFRSIFKDAVLGKLQNEQAPEKIAETAKNLWDSQFQPVAELVVKGLGGPSAFVGGKENPIPADKQTGRLPAEEAEQQASRLVKK